MTTIWKLIASTVFAIGLLGSAHAEPQWPATLKSLQPFVHFDEGEGHGVAFEYQSRNKQQFAAWLRAGKMRVACDLVARQIAEVHQGFPGEACEGAAHELETNPAYETVACEAHFEKDNWVLVTDARGKTFGLWHRKCYRGEQVLIYNKKSQDRVDTIVLASTTCGNLAVPVVRPVVKLPVVVSARPVVAASAPPAPLPTATQDKGVTCPEYYTLKVYVWEHAAMRLPGVEQTYAKEAMMATFSGGEHVSRRHWKDFLNARAAGTLRSSAIPHTFHVSLINMQEAREQNGSPLVTQELQIGQVTVTGLAEVRLRRTELERWDAVRLISVEPVDPSGGRGIFSPPYYPGSGLHELRLFNHLPPPNDGPGADLARVFGEWKFNRVPDCLIGVHLIQTPE